MNGSAECSAFAVRMAKTPESHQISGQVTRQLTTLEVEGALRHPVSRELRHQVAALVGLGERQILVDLTRLSDIDAAGVGELVRAFNITRNAGGVLQIANANRRVRQILQASGLSRVMNVSPLY